MALIVATVVIAGCSGLNPSEAEVDMPNNPEESDRAAVELADQGAAPELVNDIWLNTPEPLRLADLSGKVVLLEFWTFG
jgi:hypothetical protein